jgi:hypothetical protein
LDKLCPKLWHMAALRRFSSSIVRRGGLRPVPSLKWTVATGKQIKIYTERTLSCGGETLGTEWVL